MNLDALKLDVLASDREAERRRAICASCPSLKKAVIELCGECGCPIRSITRLNRKRCPRGLWES